MKLWGDLLISTFFIFFSDFRDTDLKIFMEYKHLRRYIWKRMHLASTGS